MLGTSDFWHSHHFYIFLRYGGRATHRAWLKRNTGGETKTTSSGSWTKWETHSLNQREKNADKWTEINWKKVSGICSTALVNIFMNDLDENTKDLLTTLWIVQSLGRREEQGSEHGKQKQDPKWIKLIPRVLLALTCCDLRSWNEEPKPYNETSPTTQV